MQGNTLACIKARLCTHAPALFHSISTREFFLPRFCPPPPPRCCRFMKLRLDRVLQIDVGPLTIDEATTSTAAVPEFKPLEKWTAPYPPYAYGWWDIFMRK